MLGVIFPLAILSIVEVSLRFAGITHARRQKLLYIPKISGFMGTYEFFIETAYSPPGYIWQTKPDTAFTDSSGFRRPEIPFEKAPDKIRVAFLGGSTTQGGYRPYPERAIRLLNAAAGTNRYEALNVACSSYSLHQSLIAFKRWVLPRKPDIVFVYHGWNDVAVAGDGYSDKEKDVLVRSEVYEQNAAMRMVAGLKLTELLAYELEALDTSWPRARVSFADFEAGLDQLATGCSRSGIRLIVMTRPSQAADLFNRPEGDAGIVSQLYAKKTFDTDDSAAVYRLNAKRITDIQRTFVSSHPGVSLCDGETVVASLVQRQMDGEFGEGVRIFRRDNCHLYEFGDELLAWDVAQSIATELSVAISNQVTSYEYCRSRAVEFYNEEAPRESLWFLNRASKAARDDTSRLDIAGMTSQAVERIEFADLFRRGRMGGDADDYTEKVTALRRCLALRPYDYGVVLQMYLVAFDSGHAGDAAELMSTFTPVRQDHRIDWMTFTLESHIAAHRMDEARLLAEKLIELSPQHTLAASILQQVSSDSAQGGQP